MRSPVLVVTLASALALAAGTAPAEIVYRCQYNICGANSDGGGEHALTTFGAQNAPLLSPSGAADASALAFIRGSTAYLVSYPSKKVTYLGVDTATEVRLRPDGGQVAVIDQRREASGALEPSLATVDPDGSDYRDVSTFAVTTGWLGAQLLRDGPSATPHDCASGSAAANCPAQSICILAADGTCGGNVADDPLRNLYDPSASPDGRLIAVTAAPYRSPPDADPVGGDIALYDTATGAFVRDLTEGDTDRHPAFSPDGRLVAFDRDDGGIYVVSVDGGVAHRVADGASPTWLGPDPAPPPPPPCRVPRLVGLRLAPARRALSAAHCRLGRVAHRRAARARHGRVVAQSPRPGATRAADAKVAVTVGR